MDINWIKAKLSETGSSQKDLADWLGISEQKVSHIFTGRRKVQAHELDQIRRFFGYTLPEDARPPLAVVGKVAAGDHVQLSDDYEKGAGLYHIERPAWVPDHGVAAAEISGSSAEPFAFEGDIIFWRREAMGVLEQDLGRPVIAELADGRVMMKRLANSAKDGCWSLLSINPSHPNLIDVELRWASRILAPLASDEINLLS